MLENCKCVAVASLILASIFLCTGLVICFMCPSWKFALVGGVSGVLGVCLQFAEKIFCYRYLHTKQLFVVTGIVLDFCTAVFFPTYFIVFVCGTHTYLFLFGAGVFGALALIVSISCLRISISSIAEDDISKTQGKTSTTGPSTKDTTQSHVANNL